MRKSGVSDYEGFARKVLDTSPTGRSRSRSSPTTPTSMTRQARLIASWGPNVYVKMPVTDTQGRAPPVDGRAALRGRGPPQRDRADDARPRSSTSRPRHWPTAPGAIVSVFAGRIADTGRDPMPLMAAALDVHVGLPKSRLLWASPREILNVRQADDLGCRHHHGDPRPADEARAVRQGPRRLLARDGPDVPRRRQGRGVPAVTGETSTANPHGHRNQDDHHPDAAAHHARRRRHRPAVLLRAVRRRGGLGRDLQVHLHLDQPHVHARLLPEVLGARTGRATPPTSSIRSCARRS